MTSLLKPVEENAINVIMIYRDVLKSDFINSVFKYVTEKLFSQSCRRVVFHVFTNRGNPFYLEDFRGFIQSNVLYTVVIRYYKLSIEEINRVISFLRENGLSIEIFIDKNLRDIVDFLERKDYSLLYF